MPERCNVLFVGEHPLIPTGNGGMMRGIISTLDASKYNLTCFAANSQSFDQSILFDTKLPFNIIQADEPRDPWGNRRLLQVASSAPIHIIVMVGIDLWRYYDIYGELHRICKERGIKWVFIFPYDCQYIIKDWVNIINHVDYPYAYSQFGKDILSQNTKNKVEHFRPAGSMTTECHPFSVEGKAKTRAQLFPTVDPTYTLFGFIGNNQMRKDPQGLLEAFAMVNQQYPNTALYMHTDFDQGVYNLRQFALDLGLKKGTILSKHANLTYGLDSMVKLYNSFDCLVNCSVQEGLSWTPLEAMGCGCPVIGSQTTAQTELLRGAGILVQPTERYFVPIRTKSGSHFVRATACNPRDIAEAMLHFIKNKNEVKNALSARGLERYSEYIENISDINEVLDKVVQDILSPVRTEPVEDAILFIQHSAAGDIFMTTRCLKGLKERHKNIPLYYMTQEKYFGLLENNPYVDKIIPWDQEVVDHRQEYFKYTYNPHGDKILPGHWGRNSNSILSDFYWKILRVNPTDFILKPERPEPYIVDALSKVKEYAILHTTGGDPEFRTYKFMDYIARYFKAKGIFTIQLGGKNDHTAAADLDLRGSLSYRQAAYVVKGAKIAVTVDSFMGHLVGALGVSQVCLFGSGNHNVVRPLQTKGVLICRVPDYIMQCPGLGPCSASVRDCPVKCTGIHDPNDIINDLDKILGKHIKVDGAYSVCVGGAV